MQTLQEDLLPGKLGKIISASRIWRLREWCAYDTDRQTLKLSHFILQYFLLPSNQHRTLTFVGKHRKLYFRICRHNLQTNMVYTVASNESESNGKTYYLAHTLLKTHLRRRNIHSQQWFNWKTRRNKHYARRRPVWARMSRLLNLPKFKTITRGSTCGRRGDTRLRYMREDRHRWGENNQRSPLTRKLVRNLKGIQFGTWLHQRKIRMVTTQETRCDLCSFVKTETRNSFHLNKTSWFINWTTQYNNLCVIHSCSIWY